MMEMAEIKRQLSLSEVDRALAFELLRSCGHLIRLHGASNREILDCIIRAVEKRKRFQEYDPQFGTMISALCREAGLFPYLEPENTSWQDAIAKEMYRDPTGSKIVFHVEQARIFNELAAGRGVALSAPTSFGKSLLVDATIRARQPNIVVVVVPTISLLDETRRRIHSTFSPTYQIVSLNSQVRTQEKAIFIGTQERLTDRRDIAEIDLLVIDEFYKLDYSKTDTRAMTLNILLATLGPIAKQIYMLGPLVDEFSIEGPLRGRVSSFQSEYAPVTAEFFDLTTRLDPRAALWEVIQKYHNEPTLIFSGSPPRANALANFLASHDLPFANRAIVRLADWASENFHPDWPVVGALRKGIGLHHGRVPRSMSQLFVRLFNKGLLKQLICTSSLIEGVNTVAKNVCIFDKTIDGRKGLNSFEFQNIRGRAGRMFKHYVGRIFLFNRPPPEESLKLRVPAFAELDDAPDEMLLQIGEQGDYSTEKRIAIVRDRILSEQTLTNWSKYGIENLESLALAVWIRLEEGDFAMLWNGYGRYEELLESYGFLWENFQFDKENLSAGQFVHFINCFRRFGNVRQTLNYLIDSGEGRFDSAKTIEGFFACLRGAEYTFSNVLLCLQDVIRDVATGIDEAEVMVRENLEYSYFARELQNWFLPGALRGLDEYGIPLPLIIKYQSTLPDHDVDAAIGELRSMIESKRIVGIEAAIIRSSF